MAKKAKRYSSEFKERMVELIRSGRNYTDLAREFGVTDFSIRSWVQKADRIDKPLSPKSIALNEAEELRQLRKENKILREEREILKKAAAWFAQETGTPSGKRSSS